MAIAPKSLSFLFILALFSIQIHARDSQFFSKVTTINPTTTTPTTTTTTTTIDGKNGKETTAVPTNEQESVTRQEREPTFTHETQNGNYGLYSQQQEETNQFPTATKLGNSPYTTTTTYTPYRAQTQETYTNSYPTSNNYHDQNNNQFYNADNYNNNNAYYEEQQQQEEDTRDTRYYYPSTRTSTSSTNNNNNNVEKQGMSDTRYLENGKYYYDVKNEKYNYYPTHQYQNSRSSYTTEGYNYNNNNEQFYDTNSNNEQYIP